MQTTGMRQVTLQDFSTEITPYYHDYTSSSTAYYYRNYILKALEYLRLNNIAYPPGLPYAILIDDGDLPNGPITIERISHLRCDGLVETCYEWSTLDVWGWQNGGSTFYNIMNYPEKHNDRPDLTPNPYTELSPRAQRGDFSNSNTNFQEASPNLYEPEIP